MKKLEVIIGKLADPKVDPNTDPDLAGLTEKEMVLYILQVLARRLG